MIDFKKYFSGCKLTKRQRRVIRQEVSRLTDYFAYPAEIPLQIGYIYSCSLNGVVLGVNVKENQVRADKFIKMSAEKGAALGMEAWGLRLYDKGDYKGALNWLEKSDTFNDSEVLEDIREKLNGDLK